MPRPTTFRLSDGTLTMLDELREQLSSLDFELLHHDLPEDVRGAYTRTEALTIAIHRGALNMRDPRAAEAYWRVVADRRDGTAPAVAGAQPRRPAAP